MHLKQWALALSFCLVVGLVGQAQTPTADDARIDVLLRKLGSSSFVQREMARKELEAAGIPALDALRRAKKSTDAETNRRIGELIRHFEEQTLTRQIFAPKEVHLKVTGVTVQQSIAELASLSGYAIVFQGNGMPPADRPLADKKITLDTGKTTFWQALDQLCEQGGLMERIDVTPQPPEMPMPMRGKGLRRIPMVPMTPAPTGPIVLTNRGNQKSMISYAGSVKTELRISRVGGGAKELDLLFVVSAEPRFVSSAVAGRPILDKLLDGKSQKLAEAVEMSGPGAPIWSGTDAQPYRRFTGIRVKEGPQAAMQLKEIAGRFTLQVDLRNETLARIDKIMEAAGKSADGANGGTLKVQAVKKLDNGDIEVQVALANITANPFGANVIINGGNAIIRGNINGRMIIGPNGVQMSGSGQGDLPDLVDAKGQKYKVSSVAGDTFQFVNGSTARNATIVYQANPGQGAPRELVLFGTRTHTIAVPFRFENLPLP